jgi:nitrile hydratase subunit beta
VSPYAPGQLVRVRLEDPPVHTRAPRYVRGHVGEVVAVHGSHRLPDAVVAGRPGVAPSPVYAVRFAARDLFGDGDHCVTVNLWHEYLEACEA